MTRMPLNQILTLLLLISLVGCAQFKRSPPRLAVIPAPASDAPRVSLTRPAPADQAVISTVSNRSAPLVTVIDSRPDVQKLYYPGQTDPHHWRDAVTVLPLESFQPGFNELLQQSLTTALQNRSQYQTLVCEVTSFQVALDERERAESDLLYGFKTWDDDRVEREADEERNRRQEEERRQERVRYGQEDEKRSVTDSIVGFVFNAAVVKPIKSEMTNASRDRKQTVYPQTIPDSLTEGLQSGWNCQLSVNLQARTTDGGRVDNIPIQVATHLAKDDSLSVEAQMQRIVLAAVQKLTQQLQHAADG